MPFPLKLSNCSSYLVFIHPRCWCGNFSRGVLKQ